MHLSEFMPKSFSLIKKIPGSVFIYRKVACLKNAATIYIKFIVHRAKGSPIPPPHFIKVYWLKRYGKKFKINTFIETGTYHGDTVYQLLDLFKDVHTIELGRDLWNKAHKRFRKYPHVKVYYGDSKDKLPEILTDINGRTLFWLDGHYSMGITAKGNVNTPILYELDAIKKHTRNDHLIFIDDAREFIGENDYPTLDLMIKKLKDINSKYEISVVDDIIQAIPKN